jgi:ubiquinone/menaquinone biosynthesis C-methylase UbiE
MGLGEYVETFSLFGDESRLRLCALLRDRELCVTDLVRVTGIAQSRVSTHLGRLRDAGVLRDRKQGTQCFYALAPDQLSPSVSALLEEASHATDPTLAGDRQRLLELEAERRGQLPDSAADDLERYYSPGRTWQSLALGVAALLELGDVLDVGSGDGSAAAQIAPYCRSLTLVDTNPRAIEAAAERMARYPHVRVEMADAHALPLAADAFNTVLLFHTLTHAENPEKVLAECARVLRPGGKLVLLCLDRHQQHEITARYGERHPGFSSDEVRRFLVDVGLDVKTAHVACRESKKPHLQVLLAVAEKTVPGASKERSLPKRPALG